ncbi:MAG: putative transport system permease protein, partial [Verrucomicrobiota bacterium]
MKTLFSRLGSLLRNSTRKNQIDRELTEEVGSYVELLMEKKMKEGMNEKEARRAAMVELGGVEQVKEEVRASRTGFAIETFFQDLRYGMRSLLKKPGFTLTAVIALALGIGANTAIFSAVDAVLIRALPYAEADRLVMVWEDATAAGFPRNTPAPGNYHDWARMNRAFAAIAATRGVSANITGDGVPEQVVGRAVTPSFFPVLGVAPAIGRTFTDDEDRSNAQVAVISHGLWQRRYGGDRAIAG